MNRALQNNRRPDILLKSLMAITLFAIGIQPGQSAFAVDAQPPGVAQAATPKLQLMQEANGVRGRLLAVGQMPSVSLGGFDVPGEVLLIRASGPVSVRIVSQSQQPHLASVPVTAAETYVNRAGELVAKPQPAAKMPTAAVYVAQQDQLRDAKVAKIAVSMLFDVAGETQAVQELEFFIENGTLLSRGGADLGAGVRSLGAASDQVTALARADESAQCPADVTPTPHQPMLKSLSNAALAQNMFRVWVSQIGLQTLSGASLIGAGVAAGTPLPQLQIWRSNVQQPLHIVDKNGNGLLDAEDEVRFYSGTAGDRFNMASGFTFAVDATGTGLRMGTAPGPQTQPNPNPTPRPVGGRPIYLPLIGGALGAYTSAMEEGVWEEKLFLETHATSATGEPWFSRVWRMTDGERGVDLNLATKLPLAAGTSTFIVDSTRQLADFVPKGSNTKKIRTYKLSLAVGGQSAGEQSKSGDDALWSPTYFSSVASPQVAIRLRNGTTDTTPFGPIGLELLLQRVRYSRPVQLNFAGVGAVQVNTPNPGWYQSGNMPAGGAVYDVSNPLAPQLAATNGAAFFGAAGHVYAYANGTANYPSLGGRVGAPDIVTPAAAKRILYVARADMLAGVQPLVDLRVNSGYSAAGIDAASVYNWFSNGEVSAEGIRSYFRHAFATWGANRPLAVTLVGDGSNDPFDRVKTDRCIEADSSGNCTQYANFVSVNVLPPYLLMDVDPELGETACETCFVRAQCNDVWLDKLPDIWIGRLPVATVAELTTFVNKIVAYETATPAGAWQHNYNYFADNNDSAGSFAGSNEGLITQLPGGASVVRKYFVTGTPSTGYEYNNPAIMRGEWVNAINQGNALVTYNGHANREQWAGSPDILPIADLHTGNLTGDGNRTVVVELSCETSAFHLAVATNGQQTMDERLVLQPRGPVATFGSSGWDNIPSHNRLMIGFYARMNETTPVGDKPLGDLIERAYTTMYAQLQVAGGDSHSLYTYLLLGDPMSKLQAR